MRATSAAWPLLIRYSHNIITKVDGYLAGVRTAEAIPIQEGAITFDDSGSLKRRLTMSVPARTARQRWDPGSDPAAVLANFGQRLHVRTGIDYPNGALELLDLGWYLITNWARDGDLINVEAVDLGRLVLDDRQTAPSTPPPGATFVGEFARLLGGHLAAVIEPELIDRPMPASVVWDTDREKALRDLCAAWPARWYVGDDGQAHAAVPYPAVTSTTAPVATLTDGLQGTVVERARGAQRGALFNVMVVDGKAGDDGAAAPHAVAEITDPASPIRAGGPYGRVTRFYQHDSINTQAQAQASAAAQLAIWSSGGRVETATAVPDAALELGDVARLYTADGDAHTGRVSALTLPLTATGGPMSVSVSTLPADAPEGRTRAHTSAGDGTGAGPTA